MYYLCNYSFLVWNGTAQWLQNLDYDPLGNIGMKLEYPQGYIVNNAQYGESNANPYAITSADITSTLWPQALQQIEYNSYNKMVSVAEGSDYLEIHYGHDHQRIYQELRQSGITTLKKTFVGSGLEIIERPQAGTLQKIHYLSGGDGKLFAMYIIDETNTGTLYYILTDHLGSPCLITDASGNTVQELSFDAWGKRRDPATWQPYATNATIPPAFIDRGFTFHSLPREERNGEHLYPFTLINMNGRAYDPLVGRFLSPDPYIQAPDNTQNLNRYSYCLNNPLRYTDPDGEVLIPFLVGAAIGVLTNGMNNLAHNQAFFKGAGVAALFGGISGALSFGIGQGVNKVVGFEKFAIQTLSHGHVSGVMSVMNGGTYGQGFTSGATGSAFASVAGYTFQNSSQFVQTAVSITGASLVGGFSSLAVGGSFWDGFRNGAISAGLNHFYHGLLYPKIFVDYGEESMDFDAYSKLLEDHLKANGFSKRLKVTKRTIWDDFWSWAKGEPTTRVSIKNTYSSCEPLDGGILGFAELGSNYAVVYGSGKYFGEHYNPNVIDLVNVTTHELGHSIFSFKHCSHGVMVKKYPLGSELIGFLNWQRALITKSPWGQ
jgi:RHS repeat-associated protein